MTGPWALRFVTRRLHFGHSSYTQLFKKRVFISIKQNFVSGHYITGKIIFHMLNRTNINSVKYSLKNTNRRAQQKQFVAVTDITGEGGEVPPKNLHTLQRTFTPIPRIQVINTFHHFICICTSNVCQYQHHLQHLVVSCSLLSHHNTKSLITTALTAPNMSTLPSTTHQWLSPPVSQLASVSFSALLQDACADLVMAILFYKSQTGCIKIYS